MSKSTLLLPALLTLLLSVSPALAQQDKEDVRRAIESLKAAVNQLQVAVAQLEQATNPAPIVGRPPTEQSSVAQHTSADDTIVYINFAEVQYHFLGCPRIRPGDSFERTLKRAKGPFMRCTTCSKADGSSAAIIGQQNTLAPVNTSGTVKPATRAPAPQPAASPGRCQATTKKGAQCLRNAQAGRSYCWQHP